MKKVLFIIANQDFRDEEYFEPREVLMSAGFEIFVTAGRRGECVGKNGAVVIADYELSEVSAKDYDAVVFVGGSGMSDQYANSPSVLNLAQETLKSGKVLAAICIAPKIISDAGVFKGKHVTGWNDELGSQKMYIENNGGIFVDKPVVVDGKIVTADGPKSATEFGRNIVDVLR